MTTTAEIRDARAACLRTDTDESVRERYRSFAFEAWFKNFKEN